MLHRHLETVCRLITAPVVTDAGCVSLLLCFSSFPTMDLVCALAAAMEQSSVCVCVCAWHVFRGISFGHGVGGCFRYLPIRQPKLR